MGRSGKRNRKKKPRIKGKPSSFLSNLIFLAPIAIIVLAINFYASLEKAPYWQIFDLTIFASGSLFTAWITFKWIYPKRLIFDKDYISFWNRFRYVRIAAKDINSSYSYAYKEDSYRDDRLVIISDKHQFEIKNSDFTNFEKLVTFCKENYPKACKKELIQIEQLSFNRLILGLLSVAGILIMIGYFYLSEPIYAEVATTLFTLSEKPIPIKGKEVIIGYDLKSDKHQEFIFSIRKHVHNSINDLNSGDIITVFLTKTAINTKLLKKEEPNFWTKHSGWNSIDVHGLISQDGNIMNNPIRSKILIEDLNDDLPAIYFISLLLIGMAIVGLIEDAYLKRQESESKKKRKVILDNNIVIKNRPN